MPWEKSFDKDATLDTVMQAFWSRGYEATSMQDLVDRTGVNRASLYATFGDKRALFLASLRMYDDRMRVRFLRELEENNSPNEAIRALFLVFLTGVSERKSGRGCFLTNTALELAAHDEEVRKIVAHAQEQIEGFFARMIKKGKTDGSISARVKPAETARGLLASLIGLVVLSRSRPDLKILNSVMEEAMQRLA